jgi:SAM-dependent methyltransferase
MAPATDVKTGSAGIQGPLWGARAADWAELQEPVVRPLYEAVLDRTRPGPGTAVLDAGCGSGFFASLAADRGATVSGLDAAEALLAIARSRVPGAVFRVGDLEDLPYAEASFDLVTGFNSFQYAADPVNALREARRTVRDAGRVVIAVWGRQEQCESAAYLAALGALLPPPPPGAPGPWALSEEEALAGLVRQAGLEPVESADVATPFVYADEEEAIRGLSAAGPAVRAAAEAGEERVRQAVRESIAPYRTSNGGYRVENVFRYLIAKPS